MYTNVHADNVYVRNVYVDNVYVDNVHRDNVYAKETAEEAAEEEAKKAAKEAAKEAAKDSTREAATLQDRLSKHFKMCQDKTILKKTKTLQSPSRPFKTCSRHCCQKA